MSFLSVEEDSAERRFRRSEGPLPEISLSELRPLVQGQSRKMSLTESVTNTAVGFWINTLANYFLILPLFGFRPSVLDSMGMSILFTILSVGRNYVLRRFFNAVG